MKRTGMKTSKNPPLPAYSIVDLVPLEKLQQFQDTFAKAGQIASTLTDINGVPITKPSNHCTVCQLIRETDEGLRRCILSGKELGLRARKEQRLLHQTCKSIGFTDGAAPIVVNGHHIANWLIGQNHVGEVDRKRVAEYAIEIGQDPDAMVREFEKMPKHSLKEFESKLALLEFMANELSRMGYLNLVLRQQAEELSAAKKQLEDQKKLLEVKVAERTHELADANNQLESEIKRKDKIQKRQSILVTAITSAAESIIITTSKGRIIYANPAFEKMTGYSQKEIIGKNPRILKSGLQDETFYKNMWETISSGTPWSGVITNRRKDTSTYQEQCTISPVMDEEGNILNYVGVKKDISRELALEKQLSQAQRLEAIGTLAAGIAHEINSPIQFLLNNTDFLMDVIKDFTVLTNGYKELTQQATGLDQMHSAVDRVRALEEELEPDYLSEEATRALQQNHSGIDRIAEIIRALKTFADPGPATLEPTNLNQLIENTVTVSRNLWQASAELRLNLDHTLPAVPVFAGSIKQVLLDMIVNSVHAIELKNETSPGHFGTINIATYTSEKDVKVTIEDNGVGIEPDVIDRIFDPFFTTRSVGEGTGQGLSTAHSIITDRHGGSLTVEGNPGRGARFTISLPLG